jgi:alanine racemase
MSVELGGAGLRPAWAEIKLDAIRANAAALARTAQPAALLAVVKADGYGHGAVPVARAALDGGATWLGVALVEEGVELRDAGIDAPIMVLAEPPPAAAATAVANGLTPVVYTSAGIEALAAAVASSDRTEPLPVHVKVDTGMHRVGASPRDALALAKEVLRLDQLRLEGLMTHLAVADEPDNPYTTAQLVSFEAVRAELRAEGVEPPIVHAANSAGLLAAGARYDLVRCGIALYGIEPAPGVNGGVALQPALSLHARVSYVKELLAGERVSYGLRYTLERRGRVATVPLGYADGVPRRLFEVGGCVLIDGRRHPIAGAVTMDQILVDAGDADVHVGDEVVLLGRQGDDQISAAEWAQWLDTIAYEIVCQIGPRVPRRYVG